jgi:pSer/pThr/pTyr-binding forkhead associated (FHA) protein
MTIIPQISVQLVHIQGPLKGEIQIFDDTEIRIGRHPDCQVQFPKDIVTISREHARIVREGNRFKLIDQSTNGSYVNGQRVAEAFLKDGDVITFAEGGPKVSFLTQASEQPIAEQATPQPNPAQPQFDPVITTPPVEPVTPAPPQPPPIQAQAPTPAPSMPSSDKQTAADVKITITPAKVPLAIQYGPALKSFQTLPITIGKGPNCDFIINHPALVNRHAQFFFAQERYWVKDLTGTRSISVNGVVIQLQSPLDPDAEISLSATGPKFRFLGGGRLAEIEEPAPVQPPAQPQQPPPAPAAPKQELQNYLGQKAGSLFKKFFR